MNIKGFVIEGNVGRDAPLASRQLRQGNPEVSSVAKGMRKFGKLRPQPPEALRNPTGHPQLPEDHSMNDNKQSVSLFNFHKQQIRVVEIDGQPWFVAADVCRILELAPHSDGSFTRHLRRLSKDERRVSPPTENGGSCCLTLISESGLYKLVMRSDKPQAKTFQDWVTREVLPSIRKNGGYIKDQEKVATGEMAPQELALRGYEALLKIVEDMKARALAVRIYREGLRYVANEAQTPSMKRASGSVTLASPRSNNGCRMPCSSEL